MRVGRYIEEERACYTHILLCGLTMSDSLSLSLMSLGISFEGLRECMCLSLPAVTSELVQTE